MTLDETLSRLSFAAAVELSSTGTVSKVLVSLASLSWWEGLRFVAANGKVVWPV